MKELKISKKFKNNTLLNNVFLPTNKTWKSTENNNLSVIETGKDGFLFKDIIKAIKKANQMICLQSFLIQDTKIIDALVEAKIKRNVRIFIMDSAEARLDNQRFEEEESYSTKDYKRMLNEKFKNNFVHRQAHNLHAKFILIDPKTNPIGYLFTGNFNEKPFFENPELAVSLDKKQIKELYQVFVYHFWEHTTDEQTNNKQFDKVKATGNFEPPVLKNILITSPNNILSNLKSTLIQFIKEAKKSIVFSTFGFDINNELSKLILEKLKSGIQVTIYCRPREKAIIGNIEKLADNGATVYCHPLIHAKSLIIDSAEGFIFSANFENHGLNTGFEVGTSLTKKQTIDLKTIYNTWSNSFPFIYKNKISIQEVSTYNQFNKVGRLESKTINVTEKDKKEKNISKVSELIQFLDISKKPHFSSKEYIVERIAKLKPFNEMIKSTKNITKGTELITFERKKKKKITTHNTIVININKVSNIEELLTILTKNYKEMNIFVKDEK